MDVKNAKQEIDALIQSLEGKTSALSRPRKSLTTGKLYELFVLSKMIEELKQRGFSFTMNGQVLKLKQSHGQIQTYDSFIRGVSKRGSLSFRVYTDIEIQTLGSLAQSNNDRSCYHEIDLIAVEEGVLGRPVPHEILLGVECKSTGNFKKAIVKEILGIKREISFFMQPARKAKLSGTKYVYVPSNPNLEYWLAYCDRDGDLYQISPKMFGVEFRHWAP